MEHKYNGLRKLTLLIGSTLTVMAGAIVAASLPSINREFSDVPGVELLSRLVLTLPALFMAILAPLAGYFIDRTGRKQVLLYSLILYAIAGTSGLYLDTLPLILVGRAVLGIAVGGIITAIITLIGDYFQGDERSRLMGTQAAFAGMGGLIFISLGGVLADVHWRMPFIVYVASLVVWVMAVLSVYEPKSFSQAQSSETKDSKGAGKIPSRVFQVYAIALFSAIVFYMIPVQMPFILDSIEGISNAETGFAIAFVNVASVTTSLNYGRIRKRLSFPAILAIVYIVVFVGYLIISQAQSYFTMIAGIAVSGLGFGLMLPNINLWLISLSPESMRGRLVGYLNMSLFFGMFISPVAIQPLIGISNIKGSFLLMGIIMLVLASLFVVSLMIKKRMLLKRKVLP